MNNKLNGKDLDAIGCVTNISKSIAVMTASKFFKHSTREEIISTLLKVRLNPEEYLGDEIFSKFANTFVEKIEVDDSTSYKLKDEVNPYKVYGSDNIEEGAKKQMDLSMRLPISLSGALMADAHQGYGLPIGGVLATKNAVIPFGVGVDIGCRLALTIYDLDERYFIKNEFQFKKALNEYTHFGMEGNLEFTQDHEVLEREEFKQIELLKKLHPKAIRQLGSSGGGNHFVEFGLIELNENNTLNIPQGKYVALLSHSGSRGTGANIADYYTKLAMATCKLPKEAKHLAWLDLSTSEGQEYWISMTLAGDYAKANHDRIHINLAKALKINPIAKVENHHNFAWKEKDVNNNEIIVHRKGATPAYKGELGIIPGNMVDSGYLVSGKGNIESLNSASHGAGRLMSRTAAKNSITQSSLTKMLKDYGVTLIGGATDEAPRAYKNIDDVMKAQKDLVEIHGKFTPKIVRMNHE